MQRVVNYGSFLQAWALRRLLLRHGAREVFFMDIRPGRQLPGYRATGLGGLRNRAGLVMRAFFTGRLRSWLKDREFYYKLRSQFTGEFYHMLHLDESRNELPEVAVIGSDEVFNCCQPAPWGFTTQLYGDIPGVARIGSYAASFGSTTFEQLEKYGLTPEIQAAMVEMDCLSVRDANSADIVEKITGVPPLIHLDPVLVYDFTEEYSGLESGVDKNTMLIYSYTGRISDPTEVSAIRDFARRNGLRMVSLMSRYDWCDEALLPRTPFHVLACFRDAGYVVTDTFHGTIFSVVTGVPFCTLVRESNRQKLTSLLATLGLEDRSGGAGDIPTVLESPLDLTAARKIVETGRKNTDEYLKALLNVAGKPKNYG